MDRFLVWSKIGVMIFLRPTNATPLNAYFSHTITLNHLRAFFEYLNRVSYSIERDSVALDALITTPGS